MTIISRQKWLKKFNCLAHPFCNIMLDSLLFWTYFRRLTLRRTHIIDFRLTTSLIEKKMSPLDDAWCYIIDVCTVNFIMHVGIFYFSSLASLMFPLTFFTEKSATKIMMRSNSNNSITGCSLSELLILPISQNMTSVFWFIKIYTNYCSWTLRFEPQISKWCV